VIYSAASRLVLCNSLLHLLRISTENVITRVHSGSQVVNSELGKWGRNSNLDYGIAIIVGGQRNPTLSAISAAPLRLIP
jgi:hypothetical protein